MTQAILSVVGKGCIRTREDRQETTASRQPKSRRVSPLFAGGLLES